MRSIGRLHDRRILRMMDDQHPADSTPSGLPIILHPPQLAR